MRVSKGGRGVPKHTWGVRHYEVEKVERRRNALHVSWAPNATCRLEAEIMMYWSDGEQKDKLWIWAKCTNCGRRYYPEHVGVGKVDACIACGLKVDYSVKAQH